MRSKIIQHGQGLSWHNAASSVLVFSRTKTSLPFTVDSPFWNVYQNAFSWRVNFMLCDTFSSDFLMLLITVIESNPTRIYWGAPGCQALRMGHRVGDAGLGSSGQQASGACLCPALPSLAAPQTNPMRPLASSSALHKIRGQSTVNHL